jgi:hypothetical protein
MSEMNLRRMKLRIKSIVMAVVLFTCAHTYVFSQKLVDIVRVNASGISNEPDVMRRDPSDIIKVGETYYVWYSKRLLEDGFNLFPGDENGYNGYHADIWYATSKDGINWKEMGLCIKKGNRGGWDEQSAFTPNILVWEKKYYLFYTGVPKPFTNEGDRVTKSAIGLAVSDSPDGPWKKLDRPVLTCSGDPKHFDSMRVDDACLVVRNGKIYLYYKGRQWDCSWRDTKMGVAIATTPEGPYVKHPLNPVVKAGHEVMVWPLGEGVIALINTGPENLRKTLQYATDGIHFSTVYPVEKFPFAGGFYRPEAFTDSKEGGMPEWGIEISRCENCLPGLGRFEMIWIADIK